jgi:hypothetical protein
MRAAAQSEKIPMPSLLRLVLVAIVAAVAMPAAVQAVSLSPVSAPGVESLRSTTNGAVRRSKPAKHRRKYARRCGDDICSIVNGWRAFPLRGAYGYFDTGRVPCYSC